LRFEGRKLAEEEFGEFGMVWGGVVAGVLDDAFAYGEGEVEAGESGVALLEAGDDAEGVEVVVEAEAVDTEGGVEGLFSGVAEGRVADVVDQGERFGERRIEAESGGEGSSDLGDFKGVGEAAAGVVAFRAAAGEDLGLAGQPAEGAGVQDAGAIAGEGCAIGMRRFGVGSRGERLERVIDGGNGRGKKERGIFHQADCHCLPPAIAEIAQLQGTLFQRGSTASRVGLGRKGFPDVWRGPIPGRGANGIDVSVYSMEFAIPLDF